MRIKIKNNLALAIYRGFTLDSWHHGDAANPATWPKWKRFHLRIVTPNVYAPSTARTLWIYTRTKATNIQFTLDRRNLA
jgi:hypothetical protein